MRKNPSSSGRVVYFLIEMCATSAWREKVDKGLLSNNTEMFSKPIEHRTATREAQSDWRKNWAAS